jgi:hypothetical protein
VNEPECNCEQALRLKAELEAATAELVKRDAALAELRATIANVDARAGRIEAALTEAAAAEDARS